MVQNSLISIVVAFPVFINTMIKSSEIQKIVLKTNRIQFN